MPGVPFKGSVGVYRVPFKGIPRTPLKGLYRGLSGSFKGICKGSYKGFRGFRVPRDSNIIP